MAVYRVQAPDGSILRIEGPDNARPEEIEAFAAQQFGGKQKGADWEPASPTEGMSLKDKILAGGGKAFVDAWRGAGQMLGLTPQAEIDEAKRLDAPLMDTGGGIAGNIGANMLTALAPGAGTVRGAALVGGALSALQPTAAGESRLQNAATGTALGAGGAYGAKLIGRGMDAASRKMEAIAARVNAKAAADAAAETASARSLAGRSAQDTYKQMEHLRELGAEGKLTAEQAKVFKELTEELAQKAQEKLLPSAAVKKETAQLYREAIETEADRAAKLAAERLSSREAKSQIKARAKRYWPGVATGLAGLAIGGIPGGLVGSTAGLAARPMLHATRRMLQNPAVQYQALKPFAGSGFLGDMADPRFLGLLGPSIYAAQE